MGNVTSGATMMHEDVWMLARDASKVNKALTGTRLGTAGLSLPSITLAIFAPQLRHRSVTMSNPGDLPLPTCH